MRILPLFTAAALGLTAPCPVAAQQAVAASELLTWPDLTGREHPQPDQVIRYGPDIYQLSDLWRPEGVGPFPTVLMIHGGCWQTEIADRTLMDWIAGDLRERGIAVWNIDYRGVDQDGGGYPGTYLDVAKATQSLRDHAARLNLDIEPLITIGHSAGGHLALWLAAQDKLPVDSPLRVADPVIPDLVISQGGLPDLELAATPPGSGCGTEVIDTISGGGHYADTSVPRLAPLGVPQVLVNGRNDRIIPTDYATQYEADMRARGDDVDVRFIPASGHVELIAPETAAWAAAVEEIERALGRK
jgi:acetyl esterase/lipase